MYNRLIDENELNSKENSMISNYHTHTRWCRHGTGEIEDYISKAIELGMKEIAITEHVPLKGNPDSSRMLFEEFNAYNREFDQVIEKYQEQINIIKGFEAEYYPEEMDWYRYLREVRGYELFVLGQHRSDRRGGIDYFAPKGEREIRLYGDKVIEGLSTGFFEILAHPDMFLTNHYNGRLDEVSKETMKKIFKTCEKENVPVEINANGFRTGRPYPNQDIFQISKEYDLRYLINADAHDPKALGDEYILEAERFAESLGIRADAFLKNLCEVCY